MSDAGAGVPVEVREALEVLERTPAVPRALALTPADLGRTGMHPAPGRVSARQLLASWAVHDLTHLAQVARVMAKRYTHQTGPWRAYPGVLAERPS